MQAPIKDMAYDDERDVLYVLHENNDIAARMLADFASRCSSSSHALARARRARLDRGRGRCAAPWLSCPTAGH